MSKNYRLINFYNRAINRIQKSTLLNFCYTSILLANVWAKNLFRSKERGKKNELTILFDLQTDRFNFDGGRYLLILLYFFNSHRIRPNLLLRPMLFKNTLRLKHKKALLKTFRVVKKDIFSNYATITDGKPNNKSTKQICIQFTEEAPLNNKQLVFPYTLHPTYYYDGTYKRLDQWRNQHRKIKIIFSGNYRRDAYENPRFKDYFQILNRFEIFQTCQEKLGDQFQIVSSEQELDALMQGPYINKFLWIDTSKFRIKKDQWLRFLGMCDFFLACPGMEMPFAHNKIEAMSVGTIPITEYGAYFYPPLETAKNCMAFQGKERLPQVITEALRMDAQEIQVMREGVTQYYDEHLTIEGFQKKFFNQLDVLDQIIFPYITKDGIMSR